MPNPSNREYRARCADCQFRSSRWTTSFIAHVEAAGHSDRESHETFIEEASQSRADH
jgi:hypothetical protein